MGFMDDVLKGIERATKADTPENREWAKYKKDGLVETIGGQEFVDVGAAVRTKEQPKPKQARSILDKIPLNTSMEDRNGGADFGCENPSYINLIPGVTYSVDPGKS
jgi:hypothetical protein